MLNLLKKPENYFDYLYQRRNGKVPKTHWKCLLRKVHEVGLTEAYKKNNNVLQWIRRYCALSFLPSEKIDDNGFIVAHESFQYPNKNLNTSKQIEIQ